MNVTNSAGIVVNRSCRISRRGEPLLPNVQSHSVERLFEATFNSAKAYADPFNDVEVDVLFTGNSGSWRVPAFWRGGNCWTVRFVPPKPGDYQYRLESTDKQNADLNGQNGAVTITAYTGDNLALRSGTLRVSADRRHFEYTEGKPFFWLGDTWWTCLSDRLSWEGFQTLSADRKAKGFTVVQIVGGLIPSNEERAPTDPGFCNEGGSVWEPDFARINPKFFDYADRRIKHLVDHGLVPAIVGSWRQMALEMGGEKLRKHWRYLIARYGAYPVFWVVGGEVFQPQTQAQENELIQTTRYTGEIWAEIARYIRVTDPYGHPITVHELPPPYHGGFSDPSLTDFELPQPHHVGWASIATEVADLSARYLREPVKPLVQGEIGYEGLGADHHQNFQRAAFWLAMLNGAAGHTYGTIEIAEAYSTDKPLHRGRLSLFTWEEAMHFPGAAQVALNAKLLRRYPWHRFTPQPEWVTPRGTTLFEPNNTSRHFDLDLLSLWFSRCEILPEAEIPTGEWKKRQGTFRRPYAAGIPGEVRIIYVPNFGFSYGGQPPTILNLEENVCYRAFYWDPSLGVRVDLGNVERPQPGSVLLSHGLKGGIFSDWEQARAGAHRAVLAKGVHSRDLVAAAEIAAEQDAAIVFRYQDEGNFVLASYSVREKMIALREWVGGKEMPVLAETVVTLSGATIRLNAEVRDEAAIVSIGDEVQSITSPIVTLSRRVSSGRAGIFAGDPDEIRIEFRASPTLVEDQKLDRKLYDANGVYRGELSGPPEWEHYGRKKLILLDAYRPERFPYTSDWVLVLERHSSS